MASSRDRCVMWGSPYCQLGGGVSTCTRAVRERRQAAAKRCATPPSWYMAGAPRRPCAARAPHGGLNFGTIARAGARGKTSAAPDQDGEAARTVGRVARACAGCKTYQPMRGGTTEHDGDQAARGPPQAWMGGDSPFPRIGQYAFLSDCET